MSAKDSGFFKRLWKIVSLSPLLLGFIFLFRCLHALSVPGCGELDIGGFFLPHYGVHLTESQGNLV